MTRIYPTYLYRDPLLLPQKLDNNRVGTPIIFTNTIDENVNGDMLLHAYIDKLNEEIFAEMPEGLGDLGEAMWVKDEWNIIGAQMFTEARKHGWCVVQSFDDKWKVFSVQQFSDYIKEPNADGKLECVGMKFEWADFMGNSWTEELRFEDPTTHLVKFKDGNDQTFAFPDLSQAIMGIAFEIRQIRSQLTYSASKPSYQHFVYGEDADDTNIDDLDSKLRGIDNTSAIGVPEGVLSEIRVIENKNIEIIEPALEKMLQYFAGATRLPLSFYIGQRNRSGFGITDVGEKTDMLAVVNKKNSLFNNLKKYIIEIFQDVYEISIEDLELRQEQTIDEIESEDEEIDPNYQDNPSRNKELEQDGQKD